MPQVPYSPVPTVSPQGVTAPFMKIDVGPESFGASIGKGLALLGGGLEDIAELELKDRLERQNFNAADYAIKLDEWTAKTMAERARQAQGTDAYGYTTGIVKDYEAEAKKTAAGITDPRLKRQWELRMAQGRAEVFKKAYTQEWAIRDATTKGTLSRGQDTLLKKLEDNPDQFEDVVQQGNVLFDAVPGASPEVKTEMKRLWRERAQLVLANKGINSGDADAVSRATGGDNSYSRFVRGKESAGSDDLSARNPNSSARGRYQWIDSTWKGLVNSPEGKAAGLTLDGRGNAEQEEKAFRIFTKQNAGALTSAGINPTNANLYMAHFLGAGGAITFINAMKRNPDALAKDVLPGAASANKTVFYQSDRKGNLILDEDGNPIPRTLAQVYANRTAGATGGAYNPRYDNLESLPLAQRQQLRAAAEQRTAIDQQNQIALAQAQEKIFTDRLALVAAQGGTTMVTLDQAVQNGQITDYANYEKVQRAIEKFQGDLSSFNFGQRVLNREAPADPWSSDVKKGLNAVLQRTPPEQRLQKGADITRDYNVAPPDFASDLRAAIVGTDANKKLQALSIAAQLVTDNPNAFQGVDNASAITGPAIKYAFQLNTLRKTPQQAMAAVNEMFTPEYSQGQKIRNDAAKEFKKELTDKDPGFKSILDTTFWLGDIHRGYLPGQQVELRPVLHGPIATSLYADYADLAEEGFKMFGNKDEAIAFAQNRIKGLYGTVGNTIMKFAPSTIYPPQNGSHNYILDQAAADVKSYWANKKDVNNPNGVVVDVTSRDVALVPVGIDTSQAWLNPNSKSPPPYYIWYKRKTGPEPGDYENDFLRDSVGRPLRWIIKMPPGETELRRQSMEKGVQEDETRQGLMRRGGAVGVPIEPEQLQEVYQRGKPAAPVVPDRQPIDWYQGRVRGEVPPGVAPRRQVPVVPGGRRDGGPR